jgi:hypothetical protein
VESSYECGNDTSGSIIKYWELSSGYTTLVLACSAQLYIFSLVIH